jgi:hypothetical protein
MLRQLLTILAVLTGLTASVAPAQALDMGTRAVQVAEQVSVNQAQTRRSTPRLMEARRRPETREPARPLPVLPVQTPTVMLQVDRARE